MTPDSDQQKLTAILQNLGDETDASDQLMPLVYEALRNIAARQMSNEPAGQTLQPTALVHEAYLRLIGESDISWKNRGHFFATAARAMRHILVNRAKKKKAQKHGGQLKRREIDVDDLTGATQAEHVLALDDALERLEQIDSRKGQIVMLRYFAGLSVEDTAKSLDVSPATVKRDWQFARAWLNREIESGLN